MSTKNPSQKPSMRNVWLVAVIMVSIATLDQIIKQAVLNNFLPGVPYPVIGDWARIYLIFNPGAAFGLGENATWLFTTIQLIFAMGVLVASPFIEHRGLAIGMAMIGGGALGNLIDRLFREPGFWFGHVVDYISIGKFAVFNLADSFITIGVCVFILAMLIDESKYLKAKSTRRAQNSGVSGGENHE